MNGLDRRIAELKGMKDPAKLEGLEVVALLGGDYSWTTFDSKALELVDELAGEKNYMLAGVLFTLAYFKSHHRLNRGWFWAARFSIEGLDGIRIIGDGEAPTRPEAICRAYIAAREFMAKQAGKG
jgi:hypothetical protein